MDAKFHCEKRRHTVNYVFPLEQWSATEVTTLMIDGSNVSTPQTDVRDLLPWNTKYYLQLENNRIEWFIFLTAHSNCVPKLHGNLQKKSAFGERVHEAKETILVNDHVT